MRPIRILFFIPNLLHGGAEHVLTNLVNNMDSKMFTITVQTMFDVGEYKNKLNSNIRYIGGLSWYFPGNTHVFKMLSPKLLFKRYITEEYDIIVSYLEGPSARVISGCPKTRSERLICWIHSDFDDRRYASCVFRNQKEMIDCYNRFDEIACVSNNVLKSYIRLFGNTGNTNVVYNTVESDLIKSLSQEIVSDVHFLKEEINLISVGKLQKVKGYDRLINIVKELRGKKYPVHLFIVGKGEEYDNLQKTASKLGITEYVTFVGFRENPYKYIKAADIYICSSYREGFSTAVTEALIVGTPVVSVDCSGATELLGDHNEYGIVVENNKAGLLNGIEMMLKKETYQYYRSITASRGEQFITNSTVRLAEELFKRVLR